MAAAAACATRPLAVDEPVSVLIDRASPGRRTVSRSSPEIRTFWQAVTALDPTFAERNPVSDSEREFASALSLVMAGEADSAELKLDSLRISSGDSLVRSASRILLTAMLQYQDKWKILSSLGPDSGEFVDRIRDRAGVEAWAAAFRNVGPKAVVFPSRPVVLPLTLSAAGTPVIPVRVNGKQLLFWLDTGSSMSIIASDVAALSGVEALGADTLEVATTTGRMQARPATINQLQLGGVTISNSTAIIVDQGTLRIHARDDVRTPEQALKVDGIIGFDVISRLDLRIDYVSDRITLSRPVRPAGSSRRARNFFWMGMPIVRLITRDGVPIHFTLDTGAQETFFTDVLPRKVKVRTFLGERRLVGGFSGQQRVRGRFIHELHLSLAGQPLLFRKVLVFTPLYPSFVRLDGIFGSDIGKTGVVRIDATNGLFMIEESQRRPALRGGG